MNNHSLREFAKNELAKNDINHLIAKASVTNLDVRELLNLQQFYDK